MTITIELPDFQKFYDLNNIILKKTLELESLKLFLEEQEAKVVKTIFDDPEKYNINGKPPSMEYVKNTWKITGLDNIELATLRKNILEAQANLDFSRREYEILKIAVETWRTQSANERGSFS